MTIKEYKLFYINTDGCVVCSHASDREDAMQRIKEILGTFNETCFERIEVKPYRSRYAQSVHNPRRYDYEAV